MRRKRALFLACLLVGMLGGASAVGLAALEGFPFGLIDTLAVESFWGCLLGLATWLVLDHQETRRGWTLHPVMGALWTLGVVAILAWLPVLFLAGMSIAAC